MDIKIKNSKDIKKIKRCGSVIGELQRLLKEMIKPGISTWEIDILAEELAKKNGFKPAFKGYQGFPTTTCASINEEVVHGIPSKERILNEGDIVGIDFGVFKDGFYADGAFTFTVGNVDKKVDELIKVTKEALNLGISKAKPGNKLFDISKTIQEFVEKNGFSVVTDFVGHGIGRSLHEDPQIPNFVTSNDYREDSIDLKEGMVLAIEPMVNMGEYEVFVSPDDKWTVKTKDGSWSAHFEHTIAITSKGPMILTN